MVDTDELWRSDNPRWGTVREVIVREPFTGVLDDLNSDGREVELRLFEEVEGRWQLVLHLDDVSGSDGGPGGAGGWENGLFCMVGRASPSSRVRVSFGGLEDELETDPSGSWLWVRRMDPEEAQAVFSDRRPWPQLRVEPID